MIKNGLLNKTAFQFEKLVIIGPICVASSFCFHDLFNYELTKNDIFSGEIL